MSTNGGGLGSGLTNSFLYEHMLNQTIPDYEKQENLDSHLNESSRLVITPITHRMDDETVE